MSDQTPQSESGVAPSREALLETLKESVDEVFTMMLSTVAKLVEQHGSDETSKEIKTGDSVDEISLEAMVEFHGASAGAVVIKVTQEGALDIARGLLMLEDGESVDLEDIKDALGECANMVGGSLKVKALDPLGECHLDTPKIETEHLPHPNQKHAGGLVYQLSKGGTAIEIWLNEDNESKES